jgi:hypothetical protein
MSTHQEQTIDLDHPVVAAAFAALRHGQDELYVLDDVGVKQIEASLVAHANDGDLAAGVRGLFGLAAILHEQHGSKSAAEDIIVVLGRAAPKLTSINRAVADEAVEAGRKFSQATSHALAARAPTGKEPTPEGSLKAASLLPPRRRI